VDAFSRLFRSISFYEQTDVACPECDECHLTHDIVDDVYRCENCEGVFTAAADE
jgi:ribosomal protein L37AE/L43A